MLAVCFLWLALPRPKRQRIELIDHSSSAYQLLEDIGRGDASIYAAARLARKMQKDKFSAPAIDAIASLGANGKWDSNSERDLHRWLRGMYNVCLEPYTITLKLTATCL